MVKATNGQSDQWIEKPLVKITTAQKGESMKSNKEALARVNISSEAHAYLEELTQKCNLNFEAGKVNRSTLASWMVLWFKSQEKTKHISMIQKAHFDPLKHLESLVKKLKSSGSKNMSPEDLALALAPIAKKSKKAP